MRALTVGWLLLVLLMTRGADAADFCHYGVATSVLVVDRTTRFDQTDRSVFLDAVGALIDGLGAGDRLVAYTMTGDFTQSTKFFDECKPGCPEQGFLAGLFSSCGDLAAKIEFRRFRSTLAGALADLLREPEETPYSDLFRTIAEVTRAASDSARPMKSLVIFSDLLENSPFLPERDFRHMPEAEAARRLAATDLSPDVPGVSVRVFGFGRDDGPARAALPQEERRRIQAIWEKWFRAGGASQVVIGFR